jgi:hypothetical protein
MLSVVQLTRYPHSLDLSGIEWENVRTILINADSFELQPGDMNVDFIETLDSSVDFIETLDSSADFIETLDTNVDFIETLDTSVDFIETLDTSVDFIETLDSSADFIETLDTSVDFMETVISLGLLDLGHSIKLVLTVISLCVPSQ